MNRTRVCLEVLVAMAMWSAFLARGATIPASWDLGSDHDGDGGFSYGSFWALEDDSLKNNGGSSYQKSTASQSFTGLGTTVTGFQISAQVTANNQFAGDEVGIRALADSNLNN